MARDHAQIRTSIWTDRDFTALGPDAQRLYFLLLSQPSMTQAGVLPYQPRRWAQMSAGTTLRDVRDALAELSTGRYVVVDEDTEELLVRSFVRNDGVLKVPNVARAMVKAYRNILSPAIAGVFLTELQRLNDEQPALPGWGPGEVQQLLTEPIPAIVVEPLTEPFGEPLPDGYSNEGFADHGLPIPLSPSPTPSTSGAADATPARDDVERICQHLADRIEANGSKRPRITARWRDAARLLIDLDGRSEDQIHRAIDWCQADEFWRANILSLPTLREKYDQLRLIAQRPRSTGSTADDRSNAALAIAAKFDALDAHTPPALEAS